MAGAEGPQTPSDGMWGEIVMAWHWIAQAGPIFVLIVAALAVLDDPGLPVVALVGGAAAGASSLALHLVLRRRR